MVIVVYLKMAKESGRIQYGRHIPLGGRRWSHLQGDHSWRREQTLRHKTEAKPQVKPTEGDTLVSPEEVRWEQP